jgi:CBS domain-containing protein
MTPWSDIILLFHISCAPGEEEIMSVGKICNRDVVVVQKNTTVRDAAKLMRRRHVGDVVVVDRDSQRTPIGIVTDRDIVMQVIARDIDAEHLNVGQIMSKDLVVANEHDGIFETIRLMQDRVVRRIPIVNDEHHLVGIVSVDDLFELLVEEMTTLSKVAPRERRQEARVRP